VSSATTTFRPGSGGSRVGRLRTHLAVPLFRNGYSLITSTLMTSALGAVFWAVAARQYPATTLGVDAALISAMTLIANLAHLNLTNALNRFIPPAGPASARLIGVAYAIAGGLSLVAATVFVVGARWWAPSLDEVRDSILLGVVFVAATVAWVLFQLQDSALTGLGRGAALLRKNLGFAIAKIAALLALVAVYPAHGVFAAWVVPLIPAVLMVNAYVFRRFVPAHVAAESATIEQPHAATVGRFIAGDYVATLVWTAATSVQPILVLALVGAEAGAYAYIAWTISYALYLVSANMGMSMITEASRDPSRLHAYSRAALIRTYGLLVPAVALTVMAAPVGLRIFGPRYAVEATTLLRLLAMSAIPYAVVATFLAVARVQRRVGAVLAVNAAVSIPAVAMMLVLAPRWGIVGIGWAWLTSQLAVAVALLATELRSIWLPHVNGNRLAAVARPLHAAVSRLRLTPGRSERRVPDAVTNEWTPVAVASGGHDVDIVTLAAGDRRAILRMSANATGERALQRHRWALETIASLDGLSSWRVVVPTLIATGHQAGRLWVLEEGLAGGNGRTFAGTPELPALLVAAADSIGVLHRTTATVATVDEAMVDRLVGRPLAQIAALRRDRIRATADRRAIERLGDELAAGLVGVRTVNSFTHGDYWLGNLLVSGAPNRPVLTGIVDWDQAGTELPAVLDIAHLLLTARTAQRREELGATVSRFLDGGGWEPWEHRILATAATGDELTPRQLVLLTWLHHVSANLTKAERYRRAPVWIAPNIERVLEAI
jgi:O-antigen/teichoic acid export membrane protein/aminoglycoside phosphotransferase (APT) family kinase protein